MVTLLDDDIITALFLLLTTIEYHTVFDGYELQSTSKLLILNSVRH